MMVRFRSNGLGEAAFMLCRVVSGWRGTMETWGALYFIFPLKNIGGFLLGRGEEIRFSRDSAAVVGLKLSLGHASRHFGIYGLCDMKDWINNGGTVCPCTGMPTSSD